MRHLKTYLLSSMVFLFMGCGDIFSDSGFEKNKERCKSGGKKARENAKQQKGFVGYLPDVFITPGNTDDRKPLKIKSFISKL